MTQDIRWKQRFSNYLGALQTLDEACDLTPHIYDQAPADCILARSCLSSRT